MKKVMGKTFLRDKFVELNDNSAREYNQSIINYLFTVLEGSDWHAMSDYQLFLNGGKKMLEEIIEELNEAFSND